MPINNTGTHNDSVSLWHGTSIYIFLIRFYAWLPFYGLHFTALLCHSTNKPTHQANWNMFLVPSLAGEGAVWLGRMSFEPEIWSWLSVLPLSSTRCWVSWTSSLKLSSHQWAIPAHRLEFLLSTWAMAGGRALGNGGQECFYFAMRILALVRQIRKAWLLLFNLQVFVSLSFIYQQFGSLWIFLHGISFLNYYIYLKIVRIPEVSCRL